MATNVVCSNTTFVETNQRFQMVCPTLQEFFANPKCPSTLIATEVKATEVYQSEATMEPKKSASVGNQS